MILQGHISSDGNLQANLNPEGELSCGLASIGALGGELASDGNLYGKINPNTELNGSIGNLILPPSYSGVYEVTPSFTTHTLNTAGKKLEEDITVNPLWLKQYVVRPDAEFVKTYSYDKYIHADEEVDIPAYTTTAQTLKATWNLEPTIDVDLENYSYYIVERFLSIPEYSVTSKAKGRAEYTICTYIYEFARVGEDEIATLVDPTKKITTASNIIATTTLYRVLYWTSGTKIGIGSTNAYGVYQTPTAPAVSSGVLTVKSPVLGARGSTTYFTSTYMNALTDIRFQFVIDVYRVPRNNLGYDGWTPNQVFNHIVDCVNTPTHKLT